MFQRSLNPLFSDQSLRFSHIRILTLSSLYQSCMNLNTWIILRVLARNYLFFFLLLVLFFSCSSRYISIRWHPRTALTKSLTAGGSSLDPAVRPRFSRCRVSPLRCRIRHHCLHPHIEVTTWNSITVCLNPYIWNLSKGAARLSIGPDSCGTNASLPHLTLLFLFSLSFSLSPLFLLYIRAHVYISSTTDWETFSPLCSHLSLSLLLSLYLSIYLSLSPPLNF